MTTQRSMAILGIATIPLMRVMGMGRNLWARLHQASERPMYLAIPAQDQAIPASGSGGEVRRVGVLVSRLRSAPARNRPANRGVTVPEDDPRPASVRGPCGSI